MLSIYPGYYNYRHFSHPTVQVKTVKVENSCQNACWDRLVTNMAADLKLQDHILHILIIRLSRLSSNFSLISKIKSLYSISHMIETQDVCSERDRKKRNCPN